MKRLFRINPLSAVLAGWMIALLLGGCRERSSTEFQGYLEGDYVYVASPLGGQLKKLGAQKGSDVRPGDMLFVLDSTEEQARLGEAQARLDQARARLEDLKKGARPTELESLAAVQKQVEAVVELSGRDLDRAEKLHRDRAIPDNDYDRIRLAHQRNQQQLVEAQSRLETARLGGRDDAIQAAAEEVRADEEQVAAATWRLDQKTQNAPAAGRIQDTLYREGEWVPAALPVVVLLPPENIKVRFFIPEPTLHRVSIGQKVSVILSDTEKTSLPAEIRYVSTKPEYTPPVIFSRDQRSKLIFMVEASFNPEDAARLHPGQPVDVKL